MSPPATKHPPGAGWDRDKDRDEAHCSQPAQLAAPTTGLVGQRVPVRCVVCRLHPVAPCPPQPGQAGQGSPELCLQGRVGPGFPHPWWHLHAPCSHCCATHWYTSGTVGRRQGLAAIKLSQWG